MKGKTIIVTGASTGIGKSIAQLFIKKGSNVIMNARNKQRLKEAYTEFGSPSNAVIVAGDVSLRSTNQQLVDAAIEHFGSVDVLVNNAGIFSPKPFLNVEEEDLEQFLNVNLKGTYFTSQAAIRQMLRQDGGSIINIGTVLVDHAIDGFPASAAVSVKGAIHTLSRQLAAEFGKDNIRVNTVSPGIIRSPLQGKIGISDADSLAGLHLLNRIGEPEEVAEAVYFLAQSKFITGETINVAGGHTIGHALSN